MNATAPPAAAAGDPRSAEVDAALVERWALAYLGRYATSAENLRRVLRRRLRRHAAADSAAVRAGDTLIDTVVTRYGGAGLIDDAAYAASRARRGLERGRSPQRIAAGLAAKGVGAADRAAALAALGDGGADPELVAAGVFARRRRLGPFRSGPADRQRDLAAFARAGFSRQAAEAILRCADEAVLARLLAGDPG